MHSYRAENNVRDTQRVRDSNHHGQSPDMVLKQTLKELSSTIANRERRLFALKALMIEIDHDDQPRHDAELMAHTDAILYQKLALALAIDKTSEEVPLVCSALEVVYRASRVCVARAFQETGVHVLPLLKRIIEKPVVKSCSSYGVEEEDDEEDKKEREKRNKNGGGRGVHFEEEKTVRSEYPNVGTCNSLEDEKMEMKSECSIVSTADSGIFANNHSKPKTKKPKKPKTPKQPKPPPRPPTPKTQVVEVHQPMNDTDSEILRRGPQTQTILSKTPSGKNMRVEMERRLAKTSSGRDVTATKLTKTVLVEEDEEEEERGSSNISTVEEVDEEEEESSSSGSEKEEESVEEVFGEEESDDVMTGASSTKEEEKERSSTVLSDNDDDYIFLDGEEEETAYTAATGTTAATTGDGDDKISRFAAVKVLAILRVYSRVLAAMIPIAKHPGMIDSLLHQLNLFKYKEKRQIRKPNTSNETGSVITDDEDEENDEDFDFEVMEYKTNIRVNIIAILVNLACAEDNKPLMIAQPTLLDTIITHTVQDPSSDAREHAAIVLMNLSFAESNKPIMLQNKRLIPCLLNIIHTEHHSPTIRQYASAAIESLSDDLPPSVPSHIIVTTPILKTLTSLLVKETNPTTRFNAAKSLHNISQTTSHTALKTMASHPNLLVTLAITICTDEVETIQTRCAQTLNSLANYIHHPDPSHPELLESLVKAASEGPPNQSSCLAQALKVQSQHMANRKYMGSQAKILNALADLASVDALLVDRKTKLCALAALEGLSREEDVKGLMSQNEKVMGVLTYHARDEDFDEECADKANEALNSLM